MLYNCGMDIRETKAQLDVLQLIYEQEYIRTPHLSALLPHRDYSSLTRTLKTLESRNLIKRFRNNMYSTYIFHITEAGKKTLFKHRGPHHYVRTYRPIEDYRIEFQHKVGIAETIANLRVGALANGCRIISQGEIEENMGREDENLHSASRRQPCGRDTHRHRGTAIFNPTVCSASSIPTVSGLISSWSISAPERCG